MFNVRNQRSALQLQPQVVVPGLLRWPARKCEAQCFIAGNE
jgi:hypothetical protein